MICVSVYVDETAILKSHSDDNYVFNMFLLTMEDMYLEKSEYVCIQTAVNQDQTEKMQIRECISEDDSLLTLSYGSGCSEPAVPPTTLR